ncbi:hypothetical protein KM043_009289 [Ampulex compressa]|nr:hypothetical protein KM043_009289 [Ampulex compressa]
MDFPQAKKGKRRAEPRRIPKNAPIVSAGGEDSDIVGRLVTRKIDNEGRKGGWRPLTPANGPSPGFLLGRRRAPHSGVTIGGAESHLDHGVAQEFAHVLDTELARLRICPSVTKSSIHGSTNGPE